MTRWIRVLRRLNRFFDHVLVWPQPVAAVNDRAAADVLSALPAARPSLGLLAQRAREHRKEVIDHNDALDRKLTTMMTAAGAYFGLLVNATVRDSTTNDSPWMLLALVMAVLSVLVALYGLTPRAFNAPNLEWLVSAAVDDEEDTVADLAAPRSAYFSCRQSNTACERQWSSKGGCHAVSVRSPYNDSDNRRRCLVMAKRKDEQRKLAKAVAGKKMSETVINLERAQPPKLKKKAKTP